MWQQGVLLVVAVDGTGGNDVVLVLVHQGQLGVVTHCGQMGLELQKGGHEEVLEEGGTNC